MRRKIFKGSEISEIVKILSFREARSEGMEDWKLNIESRFRKACAEYGLLEDGDRVLVGLSGGKDSLMLVRLLGGQAKIYKPRIEVIAAYISVSNIGYQADVDYLSAFCAEHGVRFEHVVTSYEEQEPQHRNKNHCFLCARYRRKALLETARRLECNKIAFGHHRDDIVQTDRRAHV